MDTILQHRIKTHCNAHETVKIYMHNNAERSNGKGHGEFLAPSGLFRYISPWIRLLGRGKQVAQRVRVSGVNPPVPETFLGSLQEQGAGKEP